MLPKPKPKVVSLGRNLIVILLMSNSLMAADKAETRTVSFVKLRKVALHAIRRPPLTKEQREKLASRYTKPIERAIQDGKANEGIAIIANPTLGEKQELFYQGAPTTCDQAIIAFSCLLWLAYCAEQSGKYIINAEQKPKLQAHLTKIAYFILATTEPTVW